MKYQVKRSVSGSQYFIIEDKKILKVFISEALALSAMKKIRSSSTRQDLVSETVVHKNKSQKVSNETFIVKKNKVA